MRKGLVFKKGIIFALATAVVTSPASVMGVSGWGVMNAKAEETTTEKIPEYLLMGSTRLIDNGEFQDDGVSGNDDTIYQGTNWYYDITRNQLVLENASISGNITIQNGDLSIMLSGTNTMRSDMVIQSILTESGIVPTLEINGNNHNGSLSCGSISVADLGSNNNNLKINNATLDSYSKVMNICKIQDVFEFVDKYNKKFNINLDINKLINDGIIDFDSLEYEKMVSERRDECVELNGQCCSDGNSIIVKNYGSLSDAVTLIHELSHYKDIPDKSNETRFWFTEALAITEELIAVDELNDIDLKEGIIYVKHNVYDKLKDEKGRWYIGGTKTPTGTRKIYICQTLLNALKNYKKKQTHLKHLYGSNYKYYHLEDVKNEYGKVVEQRIVANENNVLTFDTVNLVFTREDGTYVGTDLTKYPFKIIHEELGIKKCRFYDLRGSYATRILTNGVEIRDVADILGHRNIETTENYYISSTEDSRKRANSVFEEITQSSIINEIIKYKV